MDSLAYSKLKDTEAKNKELEEQLENMKKEMEESRSRSDKGENDDRCYDFALYMRNSLYDRLTECPLTLRLHIIFLRNILREPYINAANC